MDSMWQTELMQHAVMVSFAIHTVDEITVQQTLFRQLPIHQPCVLLRYEVTWIDMLHLQQVIESVARVPFHMQAQIVIFALPLSK